MPKVILLIGTLDTKGTEVSYMKELIEKKGHAALVMDISGLGSPPFTPDITAEDVAKAAGKSIEEVRSLKDANSAAEAMQAGAMTIVKDLYNSGRFQGVIGVGGSVGSYITSVAMRALPTGVPKLMLASQKIVQAGIRGYVGTKDIAVMPAVADIAGLNMFTRKALNDAVNAVIGMVEGPELSVSEKPLVFMTMMGTTTICGLRVKSLLEDEGFEVVVFHTVGVGGATLEDLVEAYAVRGVVDLSLNEIGNELFGGASTAGPRRLEAAGKKGIPQIIATGNVDFIGFVGLANVPDKYKNRKLTSHTPEAAAMRLNADELKIAAETIAEKLNQAAGPVKVLIPTRGFSAWDQEGKKFWDPDADRVFIRALESALAPHIVVREIDAHINDTDFADEVFKEALQLIGN
jgi:uncharacterized protein (UPF0261 family)